jgi:hypothetical protein
MTNRFNDAAINCNDAYETAHNEVLNNPYWFGDRPGLLTATFDAANTKARSKIVRDVLRRAGEVRSNVAHEYSILADKLSTCGKIPCGSSACLNCLRAFQQAKSIAHRSVISEVLKLYPNKLVYLVTIIPRERNYRRNTLHDFDAEKFKRLVATGFAGYRIPFVGSIDFDLQMVLQGKYFQPHFHAIMHTSDYEEWRSHLKWYFPPLGKSEYPVDLTEMLDLKAVPYVHKIIKIMALLRNGQRYLPELLLTLDRIEPLDLMTNQGLVLSAQNGGLKLDIA